MSSLFLSAVLAFIASLFLSVYICESTVKAGFPLPPSQTRMGLVDGLRGFLSLSVLAFHFLIQTQWHVFNVPWSPPDIPFFNRLGELAVNLFFMTTGLVFYKRVLGGLRGTFWPSLYLNRIFRIMPLLIVSVILVLLVAVRRTGVSPTWDDGVSLLTWITAQDEPDLVGYTGTKLINAYVLWTLRIEWRFYLLVIPICALVIDLTRGQVPTWCVPAGLLAIGVLAQITGIHIPLDAYLPFFAAGMLTFEASRSPLILAWCRRWSTGIVAVTGLTTAVLLTPDQRWFAFPFLSLLFACAAFGSSSFGILSRKGSVMLGEISFSIYLIHGIVLSVFFIDGSWIYKWFNPNAVIWTLPLLMAATIGLSAITYLGIERPAIRLGAQITKRWADRRTAASAPEIEVAP